MTSKRTARADAATPRAAKVRTVSALHEERRIREGLTMVQAEARRLWYRLGRRIELDELTSLGRAALVEIVRSYDDRRASFAGYARARLRWAILDGVRKQTHSRAAAARARGLEASDRLCHADRRRPSLLGSPPDELAARQRLASLLRTHADALGIGLLASDAHLPSGGETPEESTLRRAASSELRAAVRSLPPRERALVEGHYFEDKRFDQIAEELGITKSWASRLHRRAIRVLAAQLGGSP